MTWRTLAVGHEQQLGDTGADRHRGGDAGQAAAAPGRNSRAVARRQRRVGDPGRPHEPARWPISPVSPGRRPRWSRAVTDADLVFFDGTFWSSDELIALGLGTRRAEEMAHWPVGGPDGSLPFLSRLRGRRILIHINNTNPVLRAGSAEQRAVARRPASRSPPTAWRSRCERRRSDAAGRPKSSSARLRAEGVRRYHDQHPFHQRMHAGALSRAELQAWTLNRYYYQTRIPIKDAVIVSKSEDPAFRRAWIRRIHDHDGRGRGGLALWLRLAEAVGPGPRGGRELPARAARRALRVRFLRDAVPREPAGRGRGVVADRDVRARSDVQADRRVGAALSLGRRRSAGVLPRPRPARAPRRRRGAGLRGRRTRRPAPLQEMCVAALVRKTEILWHLVDCVQAASAGAPPA